MMSDDGVVAGLDEAATQRGMSVACGSDQTVEVSISGGVVTVSVRGASVVRGGGESLPIDDLSRHRARRALEARGDLLTRQEAADYTRRSVRVFDRTLRPRLHNAGTEARPLFLREDLDRCLHGGASHGEASHALHHGGAANDAVPQAPHSPARPPSSPPPPSPAARGFVRQSAAGKAALERLRGSNKPTK